MKPPLLSGNEVIHAFLKGGYVKVSQRGSHVKLLHPTKEIVLIIPNHKEVDRWTLKGIIKDSGMTIEEFIALVK